jgi:hypothetical protein
MGSTLHDAADALDAFTFSAPDALGLLPQDLPTDPDLRSTLVLPALPSFDYELPAFTDAATESDEWEQRVGVAAIAMIDHLFRQVDEKMAPLSTLFRGAQNTTADSTRKQHRAWVASELLTTGALGEKVSEAALERTANADPRHLRYAAAMRRLEDAYNRLWADRRALERMLAERDHRIGTYNTEMRNTR